MPELHTHSQTTKKPTQCVFHNNFNAWFEPACILRTPKVVTKNCCLLPKRMEPHSHGNAYSQSRLHDFPHTHTHFVLSMSSFCLITWLESLDQTHTLTALFSLCLTVLLKLPLRWNKWHTGLGHCQAPCAQLMRFD